MKAVKVWFDDTYINIETDTGKAGKLALSDFPPLSRATPEQRENYNQTPFGIHWPDLDEDLSYEGFFTYQAPDRSELREKLNALWEVINWSCVAERYFGKSRNWLLQRIHNYKVNGKPAAFTPAELDELAKALDDISRQIKNTTPTLSR